jgi:phosphoribosylamine-glycine ligase
MKFLFITNESLSADLAWQLKKEGHEVKMYCHGQGEKDVGLGFFEKVDEWEPLKDWADVIIFDDIGFGNKAEQLRNEGKFVVGGSPYTDKLELDREFGQAELNGLGVDVLPSWNFTSFDEAIEFVKKTPDRYVLKPSGKAQNEKELLFIGQEADGKDILQVLEHYKANWSKKIKEFQMQKYAEGVEIAVGAFFNGKEFIMPVCVNFEHKRLFPGELGPSTGEMGTATLYTKDSPVFERTLLRTKEKLAASKYVGYVDINCIANGKGIWPLEWTCFDSETEILTKSGWKNYFEVEIGDETLSINPHTREMRWKRITGILAKDYRGEMVHLGARTKRHSGLDALVTPDHNLLIDFSGRVMFAKANSIPIHETHVIRTGHFEGRHLDTIEVPGYAEQHYLGRHGTTMEILHEPINVPAHAFMKFLGVYLAEGSIGGHHHIVNLAQSVNSRKRVQIERILRETGIKYTVQKNGTFQISSTQLVKFLDLLGLSTVEVQDKFIPPQFKDLSTDLLEALWYGYSLGDESTHRRTGQQSSATSSARLAGDLQELLIKCGKLSNISVTKQKGTISIGGYVRKSDLYTLSVRTKKLDYFLDKRVISREEYSGVVWDVEVEDWHTMLVRRNGKPFFSGNCRFGYPTISIQMEGITSDWGPFLSDLAHGNDVQLKTKKGYQVGVVIAIPPWPFEDEKAFKKYSEGATILFRRQSLDGIHIGEVKLEEGDWHIAGNSGYALVVTGSGATMSDAIDKAYQNVRNVMIPNMFYRSDIGQRWTHDSDMLLSWGYI